jgi:DNA polymerase beta
LQDVVTALEKVGLVTDTISLGDNKFMGVCRLVKEKHSDDNEENENHFRRLDIR